ncbi:zinc-dependent metalloprotease [Aureibacter tunicatorum]|uniref:Uncharacterized protein YwlG (UPF0340 family) n=1 Tax=Aureibacter tunicatorum TaxID=866807 RepID=A0AAE3XPY4_9BACT|nr:zinc-dependent metalloprotease [Aureibacter tunicatorum]MDR6240558.1 uncharacterized protein YwlG (UPF0340 family) [Aureibacter tunicatorum]BDD06581.1 hypothetical protein AUTU_40640 [Aureibacter tunicatorum]
MKKRLLLLGTLATMSLSTLFAQKGKVDNQFPEIKCATSHANKLVGTDGSSVPANSRIQAPDTYRIPVVFHVYGTNFNGYSVSDAIVEEAIRRANEDFNGNNDDFNTIDPNFDPIKATLDVSFELAKFDENGNPTNGIVRYAAKSGYGNGTGYDDQIAADAWDNTKYVNVYIQNDLYADGSTTNSGVAWYPSDDMTARNVARIVYNGAYLANNTGKEFSSVFTHEIGHFLNLPHTFDGYSTSPCIDGDDGVDDTPPTGSGWGCNGTNCAGELINGENYMDYNVDCYKMFTQGQVSRMINALHSDARRTLWTDQNVLETLDGGDYALNIDKLYIKEGTDNDGSFDAESGLNLSIFSSQGVQQMQFAKSAGTDLVEGVDYQVANLPSGLSAVVTVVNNTTVSVNLNGSVSSHEFVDNTDFDIEFLAPAFNLSNNLLYKSKKNILIQYRDEYQVIHRVLNPSLSNIPADAADKTFYIDENLKATSDFYTWAEDGLLELGCSMGEDRQILGTIEPGTSGVNTLTYVEALDAGVTVGPSANTDLSIEWLYSNMNTNNYRYHSIYKAGKHEVWAGKTRFAGISFVNQGERYFGWIKINVSGDGTNVTVTEVAYYNKPNGNIVTGFVGTKVVASSDAFNENMTTNDGTLDPITFTVTETEFAKSSGDLVEGVDYTSENIPAGYTLKLTATSSTTVEATLVGSTNSHEAVNSIEGIVISFKDAAFASLTTEEIAATDQNLSVLYIDEYRLVYTKPDPAIFTNNSVEADVPFQFDPNNNKSSFAIWAEEGLLELYLPEGTAMWGTNQPGTAADGYYTLVSMLDAGVEVGDDPQLNSGNNWIISNQTGLPAAEGYYYHTLYKDLRAPNNRAPINHTEWAGKTMFAGLRFENRGNTHYGWVRINIDNDLETITVIDYAYHTRPNQSVITGLIEAAVEVDRDFIQVGVSANSYNSTESNIDLVAAEFNSGITGKLVEGTHYDVNGLQDGVSLELEKVSDTRVVVKAMVTDLTSVNVGDVIDGFSINFKDAAFEGKMASEVAGSNIGTISIEIVGEFEVIYLDFGWGSDDDNWASWYLFDRAVLYGIVKGNNYARLESYGDEIVVRNNNSPYYVDPLEIGDVVGPESNFKPADWDGNGDEVYFTQNGSTGSEWLGSSRYMGVKLNINDRVHYGWVKVSFSADANTWTFEEGAYYTKPNAPLTIAEESEVQDQTITFDLQSTANVGDANIALTATATSGLDVTYTSSDESVVRIENGELVIVGVGTADVTASQAGNNDYNPAADVVRSITVTDIPLGVDELSANVSVYPNPTNGVINVKSSRAEVRSIVVYNVIGEVVASTEGNNAIDLSGRHAGVYLVHIDTAVGKVVRKVLVK